MIYPNQLIRAFDRAAFVQRFQDRLERMGASVRSLKDGFEASAGGCTHTYSADGRIQSKACNVGTPSARPA